MATAQSSDPTVAPPASMGSVPGLGEAFRMNLNTGQGVYSYALKLPEGVAGHSPRLTLEYSHGTRQGPFGFGWQLDVRSIERRLDLGVPGVAPETFLDGGREITAVTDGSFGALTETAFSRYTREGDGWKVEERNGDIYELGTAPAARVADPHHADRVQSWLLERCSDVSGNVVSYTWDVTSGMPYLTEVRYAAYSVRFVYQARPDVRHDGRAGFVRALDKRCARVDLVLDPGPNEVKIRSWALTYQAAAAASGVSLLSAVQLTSFATAASAGDDVVRPPVRFTYGVFDPKDVSMGFYGAERGYPPALDDPTVALIALDQAPLPGILQIIGGKQFYWRNNGAGWDLPEMLPTAPFGGSIASAGAVFLDLNGNGEADLMLVASGSLPGYFENAGQKGWGPFVGYPRGAGATPQWTGGQIRFADNDMDGRVDAIASTSRGLVLWRNGGELGWGEPYLVQAPASAVIDFNNPLVQFADMTGDGSQDIVEVGSGSIRYFPNLGDGRFADPVYMHASPRLRDLTANSDRLFLADVDGDGCADLVYLGSDSVTVAINQNGASFAAPVVIAPIPPPIPATARVVNLKGAAAAGLVWNSYRSGGNIGYVHLEWSASSAPYLLSTIDNGAGLFSQLFYRSAVDDYLDDKAQGALWDTNFPFPLTVVARTRETDRVTGVVSDVSFRYHDAHYEPHGRRFSGFRTAERIEKGDESRADVRSVHQFLVDMERAPGNTADHAALDGSLARVDVYSLDGSALQDLPLSTEESEYAVTVLADTADGRHRSFVTVTTHRTRDVERSADARVEEKTYSYDAVGNVVREVLRASGTKDGVAQPEQVRATEMTYASITTHRVLGAPARAVVRDGAGNLLAETRTFYDGADFVGMPLGQADRGLVTRRLRLAWSQADFAAHYDASMDGATALGFVAGDDADGVASQFVATERHAYDTRGLKVAEMDPLGMTMQIAFDADGLFRVALTGPLGTASFVNDRATGQASQITYPGGAVTSFAYDAQGRLRWSVSPGDDPAKPPRQYSYDDTVVPNVRTVRMLQSAAGDVRSTVLTYFDGRGNEVQHAAQVDATKYVVSGQRAFNPWGDMKQELEPRFSPDGAFSLTPQPGAPSRTIKYDGRGRVVQSTNYDGGICTAAYFPFRVELSDANDNDTSPANVARGQAGTPRVDELDVFRQRSAVVEVLGGGRTMTTTYVNDALGRTVEIHDEAGALCVYRLDRLGNRYDFDHRAAGKRRLWYDARGRVVRSLDAAGNDLRVTMDLLGRLLRLTSAGAVLEEYTYDAAGADAFGQVSSVTYRGGAQSYQYDAAGRLTQGEHRFDGVADPQRIQYAYDPLGREIARTYSDGSRTEKTLTYNGWVTAIAGVLSSVTYDPRGLPQVIGYANGVTTTLGYLDGPGRVKNRRTAGPGGQLYEDVSYGFDPMGLLLTSNDAAPQGRGAASYAFDPLYQLVSCTTGAPETPTVSTYGYTGFTNLARMDEANRVFAFDDAAHPDRIAGVIAGGGPRQDLAYDANGNLLGLADKTFAYDEKSQLVKMTRADGLVAAYAYAPNGARVSKQVTDAGGAVTTTLFVGDEIEIRDGKLYRYAHLGPRRVGMLGPDGPRFFHTDDAGSSVFFTDASGARSGTIDQRPFGNIERATGDVGERTYGMHPFDEESGLVYMRRRYYSPDLGRFLTPDPLSLYQPHRVLGRPTALHPYAYAGNDPLDNVDYEGLSFWSVIGAIAGVIAAVVVTVLTAGVGGVLGGVVLGAILAIGIVSVSYVVAEKNEGTNLGEFFRGFMIGFNAGLNAVIGTALFGPVIGVSLGVINFLAAFDNVAGNKVYQGILGWSSWLMPMSWAVTTVGLAIFTFNAVAAIWRGAFFAANIDSIQLDWGTGTIVMHGGLIQASTWNPNGIGFNMGNFAFLDTGSRGDPAYAHETGHTLGIAAFGSIAFGVISGTEDAVTKESYSEALAESHDPNPLHPQPGDWWHMWKGDKSGP